MRRFKPEYEFDIWMPTLAPTEQLLEDYVKSQKITWLKFSQEYKKQVLAKNKKYIQALVKLSEISNITLLCWEKSPHKCHRSLILEACLSSERI